MPDRLRACRPFLIPAAVLATILATAVPAQAQNHSTWVYPGADGRLVYRTTANGDRIPDFSMVGYRGGLAPLPSVPAVVTVTPIAGDNTARIQAAIDQVAALPVGPSGYRGAVQLAPGTFEIHGQLRIGVDGVVLRGSGRWESTASNTHLVGMGPDQRAVVRIAGTGSRQMVGPVYSVADQRVPVGAMSFQLGSTAGLAVGDTVVVTRPGTQQWINDLGMDKIVQPWQPSDYNLRAERVITRIEGDRVFIDAPITTALEAQYGGGTLQRYEDPGRIYNVGVENVRGHSLHSRNESNENRAWSFIQVNRAEDVWVDQIKTMYFPYSSVHVQSGARSVTVSDAHNHQPSGQVTGGMRYAFNVDGQLVLVTGSEARDGRHDYVTGSRVMGPNVFHNSTAINAFSDTGPHHRWASGILFDQITVQGDAINIRNRGNWGTGHGWAGANSVVWNSTANSFRVQNPPTAQNWLIGSSGTIVNDTTWGSQPAGTYDSHGTRVSLGATNSLYEAQLAERMNFGTQLRFWVGDQGPSWLDGSGGWTNWSSTRHHRTNVASPGALDDVVFHLAGSAPLVTRPGASVSVHSLQFNAPNAPVTVELGAVPGRVTLGGHGITVFAGHHRIAGDAGGSGAAADLILGGSQTWEIRGDSTLVVDARLGPSSSGPRTLTKTGTGRLVLAADSGGSNSFKSAWEINEGVVRLENNGALGWSQNTVAVAGGGIGARLELAGSIAPPPHPLTLRGRTAATNFAPHVLNVSGDNVWSGDISFATGGGNYTIHSDAGRLTLAGNIASNLAGTRQLRLGGAGDGTIGGIVSNTTAGTLRVVKDGGGTWSLDGANAYTGATTVEAGALLVNGSTHAESALTVNAGGRLGGTGMVGGAATVRGGGVLSPGAGIGTLTFGSSLTLEDGAAWDWEFAFNEAKLQFDYDRVVGPQLDLLDTVTLNIYGNWQHLALGDRFTLFDGDVAGFRADRFTIVDHSDYGGRSWSDLGNGWVLSEGSLVLTAVPEPGAGLLLWALACALLLRRRR